MPMPEFDYRAVDAAGRDETGRIEASSAEAARTELLARGCTRIEIRPRHAEASGEAGHAATGTLFPASTHLGERLSELTSARAPLVEGLSAMSLEASSPRDRRMLEELSRLVASGLSLDEALSTLHGSESSVLCGVVRAGIRSGRLPQALDRYLDIEREQREQRRGVWMAMAYPLILLGCSLVVLIDLVGIVVPQFQSITDDFGVQVPAVTRLLYGAAWLLHAYWQAGLITAALIGVGGWIVSRKLLSPAWRSMFLDCLPLVGSWRRNLSLAQFCRLLALLVEGRTPLPEAVRLAGAGADPALAPASERLAADLEAGFPPADAINESPEFPRVMGAVFRWHDRGPAFPEGLERLASHLRGKSELQLTFIAIVCEPAIILGLGMTFAFVVISLFLPLTRLLVGLS